MTSAEFVTLRLYLFQPGPCRYIVSTVSRVDKVTNDQPTTLTTPFAGVSNYFA